MYYISKYCSSEIPHIQTESKTPVYMEELTAAEKQEAERILLSVIKELGNIDPEKLGNYLLRHIESDRAINNVKKPITPVNDFYGSKDWLLDLEYFAFRLTKKP